MEKRNVAMFILWDENGKALLQHRAKGAERSPDYWAFFGGGIENGETPEEAVKREAKEELGILIPHLKFFRKYSVDSGERYIFTGKLKIPLETLRSQQKEGQGLGVFDYADLKSLKISDNDRKFLRDLFSEQQNL